MLGLPQRRARRALGVQFIGMFMSLLDATIVNPGEQRRSREVLFSAGQCDVNAVWSPLH